MAGLLGGPAGLETQFGRCRLAATAPCQSRAGRQARLGVSASRVADPVLVDLKSFQGEAVGKELLALKVADADTARGLVHRYIVMIQQNSRRGTASTLTRAEVRGGGKKPYAQKGTGNARMGSIRTPLRPGGGVVFGPKPKDWSIKMNKKERRLALATALQSAAPATTVIDDITGAVTTPKTREMVAALQRWGCAPGSSTMLVLGSEEVSRNLDLATRNIPRLYVTPVHTLNAYEILKADNLVFEASALKYVQEFFGAKEPHPVSGSGGEAGAGAEAEATGAGAAAGAVEGAAGAEAAGEGAGAPDVE